jgi:hypothetical protein
MPVAKEEVHVMMFEPVSTVVLVVLNLIKLLVTLKKYSFNGWGDIITELPDEFALSTGESIEVFEEEILYKAEQ